MSTTGHENEAAELSALSDPESTCGLFCAGGYCDWRPIKSPDGFLLTGHRSNNFSVFSEPLFYIEKYDGFTVQVMRDDHE